MKTINITFRGKRAELSFQLTNTGINISWIGSAENLKDSLTIEERNSLFMIIMSK